MIPTISFYILSPTKKLMPFVCQLIQTVLTKSEERLLVVASLDLLRALDDRLWSFSDVAFIPHQIIQQEQVFARQKVQASVVLTDNIDIVRGFDGIVMNLTSEPLLQIQAKRLLEVIDSNPVQVEQGREKYRHYQAQLNYASLPSGNHSAIQVFQIQ